MAEYDAVNRTYSPDVITGRPIELGGSLGRVETVTKAGSYYSFGSRLSIWKR